MQAGTMISVIVIDNLIKSLEVDISNGYIIDVIVELQHWVKVWKLQIDTNLEDYGLVGQKQNDWLS